MQQLFYVHCYSSHYNVNCRFIVPALTGDAAAALAESYAGSSYRAEYWLRIDNITEVTEL